MQITLDNEILHIETGATLQDVILKTGLSDKSIVLGKVNEQVRPLNYVLRDNDVVKFITLKDKEGMQAYRRTLLLILAHAVKVIYPTCTLADCKVTDTGFYYNFDFKTPIKNEDLDKISDEMKKIIKSDLPISTYELSKKDAVKKMKAFKEFYKLQTIMDSDSENVVFYKEGSFSELYFGQTLSSTGKAKNFKLNKVSGAYYLGDKKNNMLTRISAVAFEKKSQIDDYYQNLKESESVAHLKLGKKLGYYTTSQSIGKGLPIILSKGEFVIKALKRLIEDNEIARGFTWIRTPVLAKTSFYKKRANFDKKDMLYHIDLGKKERHNLSLRSNMTAFHLETFATEFKSYKDLPVRYAENSISFTNVESGSVKGLVKARQCTAYEENIICLDRQFKEEISSSIDRILNFFDCLGFSDDVIIRLGVKGGRESSKYLCSNADFNEQENLLKAILDEKGLKYVEKVGACTYFGPTVQFLLKNSYRKDDVIITLQLDKELPKLFDLKYTERNGKKCNPVSIHLIGEGGYEKVLAYLIEKYKGAMPIWLAPIQVEVISVGKQSETHAKEIYDDLVRNGFRCIINLKNENINKKIKESQINQIPYTVIVGNKEESKITIRKYASNKLNEIEVEKFINSIQEEIKNKR